MSHKVIMSTKENKGRTWKELRKGLFSSQSSEWETPQELFDELNEEFGFDLDPCATNKNAKCSLYFTKEEDGLKRKWSPCYEDVWQWVAGITVNSVFMNPPCGREVGKWIKKAYEESRNGCTVVCLLPARTDTKWFHDYCLKGEIRFIKSRLYFKDQNGKTGRAPFPSMIVVFNRVA